LETDHPGFAGDGRGSRDPFRSEDHQPRALTFRFFSPIVPTPGTSTSSATDTDNKVEHPERLSEEQIRTAIATALRNDHVAVAIGYLRYIKDGDSKQEECQRVFGFYIANHKLDDAGAVVRLYWQG
jgi:hypothetical protein